MIREYIRPAPLVDILEEHMEEAAFMYECRIRSFVDPELSWEDLLDYEQRMFPHLHALALGGFDSAKFLKDKLTLDGDEEPGETFVASYIYTTLKLIEPMQWLLDALGQQPPHFKAIVDGLKYSKSKELDGWLEYFIEYENPIIRSVGAEVMGYRGLHSLKDKILQLQNDPDPCVSIAANYSLFNMGVMPDKYKLETYLGEDDPSVVLKAIELLLRLGESNIIKICREKCASSELEIIRKLIFYLAIAGDLNDVEIINDLIQRQPTIKKECLLALGMTGHAGSLDLLADQLDNIDDWDTYTAAFQGLRFITGMDFMPQFDPDEAEPEEITEYKRLWVEWLERNQNNFSEGFKWRRGEKVSPEVLYKDLNWTGNPCRNMSYLETVLRYDCPENFQSDHFYEVQYNQLKNLRNWINKKNTTFQAGLLYYKGKPVN
jgi:uncharacterized protein (TIGR02270 family)